MATAPAAAPAAAPETRTAHEAAEALSREGLAKALRDLGTFAYLDRGAIRDALLREVRMLLPSRIEPVQAPPPAPASSPPALRLSADSFDVVLGFLDGADAGACRQTCRLWCAQVRSSAVFRRVLGTFVPGGQFPEIVLGEQAPPPESPDFAYRALRNAAALAPGRGPEGLGAVRPCVACFCRPRRDGFVECASCAPRGAARRRDALEAELRKLGVTGASHCECYRLCVGGKDTGVGLMSSRFGEVRLRTDLAAACLFGDAELQRIAFKRNVSSNSRRLKGIARTRRFSSSEPLSWASAFRTSLARDIVHIRRKGRRCYSCGNITVLDRDCCYPGCRHVVPLRDDECGRCGRHYPSGYCARCDQDTGVEPDDD